MTVSATFCVYLHDRGAKQSEKSLHSHSAPWCWNMAEKGETECARLLAKGHFFPGTMEESTAFVCLPVNSELGARQCICCRLSQCVCVQEGYLYKDIVGVLDLWGSQFKQRDPPPLHPLIHVAVEAFSLKLNKRALDNRSRQSSSFVCALNLSATFLPFIPSFFHLCHFLSLSGPVPRSAPANSSCPPPGLAYRAFDYLEPAVWKCLISSFLAVESLSAIVGVGEIYCHIKCFSGRCKNSTHAELWPSK